MTFRVALLSAAFAAGLGATATEAQTRTQKVFDQWVVTCLERDQKTQCAIAQTLSTQRNRRLAFGWSVHRNDNGSMTASLSTPTGVLLPEGIKVAFDGSQPITVPFKTCGPRQCVAELDFTSEWAQAFSSGEAVSVSFQSAAGRPVDVKLNLKGFGSAYDFFTQETGG